MIGHQPTFYEEFPRTRKIRGSNTIRILSVSASSTNSQENKECKRNHTAVIKSSNVRLNNDNRRG
jgi:hypothetical protein